jgi:hypothetical protein
MGKSGVREDGASEGLASLMLAVLFPLGEASRANRALRARRPEVGGARPALRDHEVSHWRALLDGSPTLGATVDQIYEEERGRAAVVVASAQQSVGTSAIVAAVVVLTIALPAIGQMFAVSLWFLIVAFYALLALVAAVRAVRLGSFLWVDLDALDEPIDLARNSRGEQARGVLLVEVRARRAAAAAHNRAVSDSMGNLVTAAAISLRNAFIAALAWLVFEVAPGAIAAVWHDLGRSLNG